jgi:hypothetical protein
VHAHACTYTYLITYTSPSCCYAWSGLIANFEALKGLILPNLGGTLVSMKDDPSNRSYHVHNIALQGCLNSSYNTCYIYDCHGNYWSCDTHTHMCRLAVAIGVISLC